MMKFVVVIIKYIINHAKEKAKVLAKDLDVRLVKMVGCYENEGGVMPYNSGMYAREMEMMQSDKAMVTPELPTGENTTMSQVTITYQVR